MTESEIILGCQNSNVLCQKELVKRYSPMLMTVCRRYTKDKFTAHDILQEALIKVFRHIHKYKPTGSFEAWMRRICINTALQSFDKSSFKNEIHGLDGLAEPSEIPNVYAQMGAEELMVIINQLPEGFKQVFNLSVIEGMSHREIAQILGITESTSRSQLTRARVYLQKMILKRERISL